MLVLTQVFLPHFMCHNSNPACLQCMLDLLIYLCWGSVLCSSLVLRHCVCLLFVSCRCVCVCACVCVCVCARVFHRVMHRISRLPKHLVWYVNVFSSATRNVFPSLSYCLLPKCRSSVLIGFELNCVVLHSKC